MYEETTTSESSALVSEFSTGEYAEIITEIRQNTAELISLHDDIVTLNETVISIFVLVAIIFVFKVFYNYLSSLLS